MTQEEKARAYDKAIEKIKYVMEHGVSPVLNKEDLQDIFTELAESDDERIRNVIRGWIYTQPNSFFDNGISKEEMLAWLEKHKPVEHLELKAGHWYVCHRAFCCRADHLTVKEGERFMCEKDNVVKGFVIKDAEKYFKECNAPAPYEDEQKPKWSEEDSLMIDSIIDTMKWLEGKGATNMKIDWLKSLKQRMEEQQ